MVYLDDKLTFNRFVCDYLYGFDFDINWKDGDGDSKVIITIPKIDKHMVEEMVGRIMSLGSK
ncbi:hypothetical protein LCGC14_0586180 [marine sediment metagenome]|uniref:Uncharacterized protein n=1 Tax=marine sediment metagenome TaxID=412755 RepID=A0A0F9RYL1_9ZZZZ